MGGTLSSSAFPGSAFTTQIWIEQGTSNIWFTYAAIPFLPASLSVGVENVTGVIGSSYYVDGVGTAPTVGGDLMVDVSPGGAAQFTFQVEAGCALEPVVNFVDVTSGATSLTAFAATEIVAGPDDDADGLPDACSDVCPGTVIPEGVPTRFLGFYNFALMDGDTIFETAGWPGDPVGPGFTYTIEDTAGCSCEQIIDAQGLGSFSTKYGCSQFVMEDWIDLVQP